MLQYLYICYFPVSFNEKKKGISSSQRIFACTKHLLCVQQILIKIGKTFFILERKHIIICLFLPM